jgi:hypothetical protein
VRGLANDFFSSIAHHLSKGIIGVDILSFLVCADRDRQGARAEGRRKSLLRLPKALLILPLFGDIVGKNQFGV